MKASKILQLTYHFSFLLLGVLAVCYYRERLHGDGALDIFSVINRESFFFAHKRFILFFSQWLPLIGVLLKLKLKFVLILYSLGHVLFFYVLFLISHYGLKDHRAGIAYLAVLLISDGWSFFAFPMSELQYGVALIILIHSIALVHRQISWSIRITTLIILLFILTSHPFNYYIFIVAGWLFMRHLPLFKDRKWLAAALILFVGYSYMMVAMKFNNMEVLESGRDWSLSAFHPWLMFKYLTYNWQIPVMALMVIVYYRLKGNHRKGWMVLIVLSITLLLFCLHPLTLTEVPQNYILVFLGILLFPFIYQMLDVDFRYHAWTMLILIVCLLSGFLSILWQADYFVHEKKEILSVFDSLAMKKGDKFLLKKAPLSEKMIHFKNPPYYVSLLYSAENDPAETKVLQVISDPLIQYPDEVRSTLENFLNGKPDSFIISHYTNVLDREIYPKPNGHYFKLSDERYRMGSTAGENSPAELKENLKIELKLDKKWYVRALYHGPNYIQMLADIRLMYNFPDEPIYSNEANNLEIQITLVDKRGIINLPPGKRVLLCDVYQETNLPVKFLIPRRLKNFTVDAELFKDGQPLDIEHSIKINKHYLGAFAYLSSKSN